MIDRISHYTDATLIHIRSFTGSLLTLVHELPLLAAAQLLLLSDEIEKFVRTRQELIVFLLVLFFQRRFELLVLML